ncbi:DNA polymerase III subunit delta' [Porcipelethomonas sp.]|uniref:DNA polymerase III subunit delta' n=1 Tax=Porcipelethomonas sp. TaxID=2981675 RepID=UPI003EFAB85E
MIEKIYGNAFFLETIKGMFSSGRIAHSFLIYGEKGLGKKTAADYLAAALLCEKGSGVPCGECRSCRNAAMHIHPDIIYPEHSGKLNTYTVETCRKVCSDSYIAPNNGSAKVYVFADADNIQLPAQNALLKIVEEPPSFVYFIFTAGSRDAFLPTIISRVTSLGISRCSTDECAAALAYKGYDSSQISEAMDNFGGNIGMCAEYIENAGLRTIAALTKRAADSIIIRDEYGLLTVMSSPELKERQSALLFLEMLDRIIRDSLLLKLGGTGSLISCYGKGAERLTQRISVRSAGKIHEFINRAAADIKANVSPVLLMSALCGEIMNS